MPDQRKDSAVAFLEAAVAYYASLGIRVQGVMTDNGSCYRSRAFRAACKRLGLRQIFTKPYTPRTNGKAERFIQMSLREWALRAPTTPLPNAPLSCHAGFIATIGTDPTAA
jgi:transposase InsO family protein